MKRKRRQTRPCCFPKRLGSRSTLRLAFSAAMLGLLHSKSRSYAYLQRTCMISFRSRSGSACAFGMGSTLSRRAPPRTQRIRSFRTSTAAVQRAVGEDYFDADDRQQHQSGYSRPVVQWYPGHIAKAERQLQETLKAVDVVVEVRDARAAKATSHPMVAAWCAGRPRLVVLTHADQIPSPAQAAWRQAYAAFGAEHPEQAEWMDRQVQNQAKQAFKQRLKYTTIGSDAPSRSWNGERANAVSRRQQSVQASSAVEAVVFVNAKTGSGIPALTRALFKAGAYVQERRQKRGLKERNLRVGVIGYPNVGKSAMINRLLGRRRARTANTPGVTRSLQWIRVRNDEPSKKRKEFELLDSPGIIPATLVDQSDATLLAACNCIGSAAYDNQAVAAYLCEWLLSLYRLGYDNLAPEWRSKCQERYKLDPLADIPSLDGVAVVPRTGEDMLFTVADNTCRGDPEDAARKILQDFRVGRMGPICLQIAPESEQDRGQRSILDQDREASNREQQRHRTIEEEEQVRQRAIETAKERGLELPKGDEVGKGMFEGW